MTSNKCDFSLGDCIWSVGELDISQTPWAVSKDRACHWQLGEFFGVSSLAGNDLTRRREWHMSRQLRLRRANPGFSRKPESNLSVFRILPLVPPPLTFFRVLGACWKPHKSKDQKILHRSYKKFSTPKKNRFFLAPKCFLKFQENMKKSENLVRPKWNFLLSKKTKIFI